jgi:hypothetical protein
VRAHYIILCIQVFKVSSWIESNAMEPVIWTAICVNLNKLCAMGHRV